MSFKTVAVDRARATFLKILDGLKYKRIIAPNFQSALSVLASQPTVLVIYIGVLIYGLCELSPTLTFRVFSLEGINKTF
jgi:hypothetical protein